MLVLKFGGTSVANANRINQVFEIVKQLHKKNKKIAVVCSALGGITDELIRVSQLAAARDEQYRKELATIRQRHLTCIDELGLSKDKELKLYIESSVTALSDLLHGIYLLKEISSRTLDFISGQGELLSTKIIASYFNHKKLKSIYIDARRFIVTDENFGSGAVDFKTTNKTIARALGKSNEVAVITGFVSATAGGEMTTLGRGGSDYTAAIFAAALNADEIQIWTDVDGVLTADPRKVKKAFPVGSMTYTEAMEMSHFGAKVIHPPTIQPALEKKIPLYIKNTFNPTAPGTYISFNTSESNYMIKGISSIDDVVLLTLQGTGMVGVAGISARLFGALAQERINVILITQGSSEHTICFAVKPADGALARKVINDAFHLEIKAKLIERIHSESDLSIIAVIGENMRHQPGVSGKLFQALGKNGISVVATAQGSSELNISVVIRKEDLNKALNAIHQSFFLSDIRTVNVFLVGIGLIGSTLIRQLSKQRSYLRQSHAIDIIITGICNSRKMLFNEEGISLQHYKELLETKGEEMNAARFVEAMKKMNLPQTVFADCTSSDTVVKFYPDIMEHSISIVTPNKIANSSSYSNYRKLQSIAKKRNIRFMYETNVGAGLPVITTLKDLMGSGDRIIRIEAVLSGTLSYIFNTFKEGTAFDEIVKQAQEKGYTEPDPRIDLSGKDVARKLLILARETGLALEHDDIHIEQILPPSCLKAKTVEQFFTALKKSNQLFEERRKKAAAKNKVLRFIAGLENNRAYIKLEEVDSSHPFYNLSGSENIISFTTERYHPSPLVVKGPGAGAEVTAAGVFAELISIGKYFEG
jgi:aspartokinase/homoserine dehydrogenase 1